MSIWLRAIMQNKWNHVWILFPDFLNISAIVHYLSFNNINNILSEIYHLLRL